MDLSFATCNSNQTCIQCRFIRDNIVRSESLRCLSSTSCSRIFSSSAFMSSSRSANFLFWNISTFRFISSWKRRQKRERFNFPRAVKHGRLECKNRADVIGRIRLQNGLRLPKIRRKHSPLSRNTSQTEHLSRKYEVPQRMCGNLISIASPQWKPVRCRLERKTLRSAASLKAGKPMLRHVFASFCWWASLHTLLMRFIEVFHCPSHLPFWNTLPELAMPWGLVCTTLTDVLQAWDTGRLYQYYAFNFPIKMLVVD